jgi:hypothetical protein
LSFEKTLSEEQRDRLRALPLMEKNQILGQISANRIVQEIRDAMLVTHYQKYILNYIYLLIMVSILFMFRWDFNLPEPQLLACIIIRLSFFSQAEIICR